MLSLLARRPAGALGFFVIARSVKILKLAENLVNPAMASGMGCEKLVGVGGALVEQETTMLSADFIEAHRAVASCERPDHAEHHRRRAAHSEDHFFQLKR